MRRFASWIVVGGFAFSAACMMPPEDYVSDDGVDPVEPDDCAELTTAVALDWSSMRIDSRPRSLDFIQHQRSEADCPEVIEPMLPPHDDGPYQPPDIHPEMAWVWPPGGTPTVTDVTSSPAILLTSWPTPTASDALFFGDDSGLFRKLTNIHTSSPTDAWGASTVAGIDNSAVVISFDGTKVYAYNTLADLYCFNVSDGLPCNGGVGWPSTAMTGVPSRNAPWYDWRSDNVLIVNSTGTILAIDSVNGGTTATGSVGGSTSGSPIMVGTEVFIGLNGGIASRVTFNGATFSAADTTAALCSGGTECDFANAFAASILNDEVYAAVGGEVHILPADPAAPWSGGATMDVGAAAGGKTQILSSPTVHYVATGSYIYVHHEDKYGAKLYKARIPGGSFGTVRETHMHRDGPSGSEGSTPFVWDPVAWDLMDDGSAGIYVGGGHGNVGQYGCMGSDVPADRIAVSTDYGDAIQTSVVMDVSGGDVMFGTADGNGAGTVVQLDQLGVWDACGSDLSVSGGGCGGIDSCEFCGTESSGVNSHHRVRDIDVKDPHFFTDPTCQDATNRICVSFFGTCNLACECGVNYLLQAAVRGDDQTMACDGSNQCAMGAPGAAADGLLDLTLETVWRTWNKANMATNEVHLAGGLGCDEPFGTGSCSPSPSADVEVTATNSNGSGIVCLDDTWSAANTRGRNNDGSNPYDSGEPTTFYPTSTTTNNCYSTTAIPELILPLGDVELRLLNVQIGAEYLADDSGFTDGFLRGFLTEADAEATVVDLGPSVGMKKISELLRGGVGCCDGSGTLGVKSHDKDCLDGSASCSGTSNVGWWFYINFRGEGAYSSTPGQGVVTCTEK